MAGTSEGARKGWAGRKRGTKKGKAVAGLALDRGLRHVATLFARGTDKYRARKHEESKSAFANRKSLKKFSKGE